MADLQLLCDGFHAPQVAALPGAARLREVIAHCRMLHASEHSRSDQTGVVTGTFAHQPSFLVL
jgi:hypothetical protein